MLFAGIHVVCRGAWGYNQRVSCLSSLQKGFWFLEAVCPVVPQTCRIASTVILMCSLSHTRMCCSLHFCVMIAIVLTFSHVHCPNQQNVMIASHQALKRAQSRNPVLLLDEIDKMGKWGSGGDPAAALLEVCNKHRFLQ